MMNLFARVARFLFWLIFISWSVWLLRRLVGWALRGAGFGAPQSADASKPAQTTASSHRLVRDPVCGMYVDETLSIPLREGGELLHFCSLSCRDAYTVNNEKFAAS